MGTLADDILLQIFKTFIGERNYESPSEEWHTLVHVCRRWRNLAFTSPRHLNLVLLYRCPFRSAKGMLDIWPELPIFVHDFGYSSKRAGDDIVAALRLNHRVSGIRLDNTSDSGWEIFAPLMQHSFPALTHLWIKPYRPIRNAISHSFLGGSAPCLQVLEVVHLPFPGLPELLSSATNLVRLGYDNIPRSGYISPQAMVTGLSTLIRLQSLSLTFRSPGDLPDGAIRIPPPDMRTLLPALTDLCFGGSSEYVEDLVAQIDSPLLENVQITLFNQEVPQVSELAKFVCRADKLSLPHQAEVILMSHSISIGISPELQLGFDPKTLILNLDCPEPAMRLSYLARFCASSLSTLSPFESLYIHLPAYYTLPEFIDDPDPQWLELLRLFTTVKNLRLSQTVALHVALTLRGLLVERVTAVLPVLENVFISRLGTSGRVQEVISEFADMRQLSGHPVSIYDWEGEVY